MGMRPIRCENRRSRNRSIHHPLGWDSPGAFHLARPPIMRRLPYCRSSIRPKLEPLPKTSFSISAAASGGFSRLAVEAEQRTKLGLADARGILQHGLENRLQFSGRRTDDAQHLRRCRLLLQRLGEVICALAQLVEQPCILDGDHRLGGKRGPRVAASACSPCSVVRTYQKLGRCIRYAGCGTFLPRSQSGILSFPSR
jgi:hypothetical protein